jgi:hypothetical protein
VLLAGTIIIWTENFLLLTLEMPQEQKLGGGTLYLRTLSLSWALSRDATLKSWVIPLSPRFPLKLINPINDYDTCEIQKSTCTVVCVVDCPLSQQEGPSLVGYFRRNASVVPRLTALWS